MLRNIMLANAASCLAFGALFALAPAKVAAFLGAPPVWVMALLGLGLLFNGAHLILVARKAAPRRSEVIYFALGDFAWVGGTALMLGLGIWITAPAAVAVAVLVAIWVGFCGVAQWRLAPNG